MKDKNLQMLVRAGAALHWLRPRSKAPVNDRWSEAERPTWKELLAEYEEGYNVGVRLGEWSEIDGLYLHLIDLDIRDADQADDAWDALLRLWPEAEDFPYVRSGSGGESRHIYLLTEEPFHSRKICHSDGFTMVRDPKKGREVKKWDWEIDFFGTGRQAVLPPSIHPSGKPYRWGRRIDLEMLDMGVGPVVPASTVARWLGYDEHDLHQAETKPPLGMSTAEIRRVLADLPVDQYCEDRDGWLQVGMALHHETGGSEDGLRLWNEWSKQSDKFDPADQKRVWRSFGRNRHRVVRMASLVAAANEARTLSAFDDETEDREEDRADDDLDDLLGGEREAADEPDQDDADDLEEDEDDGYRGPRDKNYRRVEALNKTHALAFIKGKTVVLTTQADGSVDYSAVRHIHELYENVQVPKGEKSTEAVSKMWMRHPARRTYPRGVIFSPQGDQKGAFNLWRGWSVKPDPSKSCRLFLRHLEDNICCGNRDVYDYVLRWFAHMIQKPWDKPGVALVLKGLKGTGKDTVGEYVGGLFEHHHVKVSQPEHLYGRFNAHQEKCLLLHVEEGFWAGNKAAEGALKSVITSERIQIERKGLDVIQVPSYLRVFISSNEDWVVPASFDERRFCVLNVSDAAKGDTGYFAAIYREMKNGGQAALLHLLKTLDLTGYDVRKPPQTSGLGDQKIASLRGIDRYWYELLLSGRMPADDGFDDEGEEWSWHDGYKKIRKLDLYDDYRRWILRQRFQGDAVIETIFFSRITAICPDIETHRPWVKSGPRPRFFIMPPLPECRKAFEKLIGCKMEWDT